jgi:hypothetical protein
VSVFDPKIETLAYSRDQQILEITFKTGQVWQLFEVTATIYDEFRDTPISRLRVARDISTPSSSRNLQAFTKADYLSSGEFGAILIQDCRTNWEDQVICTW